MSERKPVMIKNARHIDGIREMIDFVRTQQGGPVIKEPTSVDLRLRRPAPLPEIGQPAGPLRESGIQSLSQSQSQSQFPTWDSGTFRLSDTENTDTDPAYESDEGFEVTRSHYPQRSPSPSPRSRRPTSAMSSRSSHKLGHSFTMELQKANNSSNKNPRRSSLDEERRHNSKTKSKTLPPVRKSTLERSRSDQVPHLDLSDVEPDPDDWAHPDNIKRPSAPSPGTPPSLDGEDSLAEDGGPIDFIESR